MPFTPDPFVFSVGRVASEPNHPMCTYNTMKFVGSPQGLTPLRWFILTAATENVLPSTALAQLVFHTLRVCVWMACVMPMAIRKNSDDAR